MTEHEQNQYRPQDVSPPGETLADLIEERHISQTELATRLSVTPKFVNELVAGKATITPSTALLLERALDIPAQFWLSRDSKYQEAKARQEADATLLADVGWLSELPVSEMRRLGWVSRCKSQVGYVAELLRFFGVASVNAWREQYVSHTVSATAYRMSATSTAQKGAIAAWLRAGELVAQQSFCEPFDRARFLEALIESRALTTTIDPIEIQSRLSQLFSMCGVVVVFVPAPRGCPVSGAVRWMAPEKALVQLSLRYKTNDNLWFTFFHECGHIALHGKKMLFLEGGEITSLEEEEANRFAADRLISKSDWDNFQPFRISKAVILEFSARVGVAPGIVLGRLQQERRVPWNRFSELKVRYSWT